MELKGMAPTVTIFTYKTADQVPLGSGEGRLKDAEDYV